jgi:hypothetical protein
MAEGTQKKGGEKMKRKKGDGSVFQRGAVWWIKYYRNGKPYRETSGSDKESKARKLLNQRLGEIALGRFVGPDADAPFARSSQPGSI